MASSGALRYAITGGCDLERHFLDPQTKVASAHRCFLNARSNCGGGGTCRMTIARPAPTTTTTPATSKGLALVAKGQFDWAETPLRELSPDEVIIEVAGCGVCHTDIAFAYEGHCHPPAAATDPGTRNRRPCCDGGGARWQLDRALRHCACRDSVRRMRRLPRRPSEHLPPTVHAGQRCRRGICDLRESTGTWPVPGTRRTSQGVTLAMLWSSRKQSRLRMRQFAVPV